MSKKLKSFSNKLSEYNLVLKQLESSKRMMKSIFKKVEAILKISTDTPRFTIGMQTDRPKSILEKSIDTPK